MPVDDERNILQIGPPKRAGDTEITPAMASGSFTESSEDTQS